MNNPNRHDKHNVIFDVTEANSCCGIVRYEYSVCCDCHVNVATLKKNGKHYIVTYDTKILKWYYAHGYKNVI